MAEVGITEGFSLSSPHDVEVRSEGYLVNGELANDTW